MLFIIVILSAEAIHLYFKCCTYRGRLEALQEQQCNRESFIATLVHDLKTPTNSQISALKVLKNGDYGTLSKEQYEIISAMSESCFYMSSLIGTILCTYSDFGNLRLHKSVFDVTDLTGMACQEVKYLLGEKRQKVTFCNSPQNITLYADKLQIRRVILNLLSNAIKYGFYKTEIRITEKVDNGDFEFYIENYSRQILPDELVKVFDKYSKTKYSYFNSASSGLGLYLVKKIVELHGGKVYAKSEKDGKCTFGFIIPNCLYKNKRCQYPEKSASSCSL